jgi:hypothetical protein
MLPVLAEDESSIFSMAALFGFLVSRETAYLLWAEMLRLNAPYGSEGGTGNKERSGWTDETGKSFVHLMVMEELGVAALPLCQETNNYILSPTHPCQPCSQDFAVIPHLNNKQRKFPALYRNPQLLYADDCSMDGPTEGARKAEQGDWEQSFFSSSTKKRISAITNIVRLLESDGMFCCASAR